MEKKDKIMVDFKLIKVLYKAGAISEQLYKMLKNKYYGGKQHV